MQWIPRYLGYRDLHLNRLKLWSNQRSFNWLPTSMRFHRCYLSYLNPFIHKNLIEFKWQYYDFFRLTRSMQFYLHNLRYWELLHKKANLRPINYFLILLPKSVLFRLNCFIRRYQIQNLRFFVHLSVYQWFWHYFCSLRTTMLSFPHYLQVLHVRMQNDKT